MVELKITVDQLKNYLGTELKVTFDGDEYDHEFVGIDLSNEGIHLITVFNDFGRASIKNIRPIVYRLSDLDKEIEHKGERFVPIVKMLELATTQIWGEPIEMTSTPDILTEGDSTGIIAYNDTERVSFTVDFDGIRKDFALYMDGSEMMLDKWDLFQKLFEWHFWKFGDEYFEHGLVIDKRKGSGNV